ncbi:MAG: DUF695 domain-containing protein [Bacteroidales bacterium]
MKDENKNWFVSTSELDGQEVITRGRRHLNYVKDSGKYTERVEIEWSYKPLPNGMPSEEQEKKMNEVAFKLADAEEAEKIGYLTAIYTGREKFIMVFYTSDVEQFAMTLHKVLDQYEQLPIQIGRIEDADWSDYKEMLKRNGMME